MTPDSLLVDKILPSPNHGERKKSPTDMIVLHYTGMPTGEAAVALLCAPESQVSCHYVVWEDGKIWQLTPESRRAWHAGASFWAGETDINSRSIGIELVNPGHDGGAPPFPQAQIDATIALVHDIAQRLRIAPQRILAHSDIAPARKKDPGEVFPWARLHEAGLGHWTPPAPIRPGPVFEPGAMGAPVATLQSMLAGLWLWRDDERRLRRSDPRRRRRLPAPFPAGKGRWHRRPFDGRNLAEFAREPAWRVVKAARRRLRFCPLQASRLQARSSAASMSVWVMRPRMR